MLLRPRPTEEPKPQQMAASEGHRIEAEKERSREAVARAEEKAHEAEVVANLTDPDERAARAAALLNKRRANR